MLASPSAIPIAIFLACHALHPVIPVLKFLLTSSIISPTVIFLATFTLSIILVEIHLALAVLLLNTLPHLCSPFIVFTAYVCFPPTLLHLILHSQISFFL